jgi:hypothetical protein
MKRNAADGLFTKPSNLPATFELEVERFHEIAKIALLPDSRSLPEFSFLTSSKNYAIFIAW